MIFAMAILIVQYFQFKWYANNFKSNQFECYLAITIKIWMLPTWIWPEKSWYHRKQNQIEELQEYSS